jgi:hypothetical protein
MVASSRWTAKKSNVAIGRSLLVVNAIGASV